MIITLLSDFGYRDSFLGIAKGILLKQVPMAHIIDLSHEVMSFHILQCSYYLKSSYFHFPEGTVHLSLFDIMHSNPSELILGEYENHLFLSSNNGLLPLALSDKAIKYYKTGVQANSYLDWMNKTAVFLKEKQLDQWDMKSMENLAPFKCPFSLNSFENNGVLECQVLHVDKYGNVIINMQQQDFESFRKGREFKIYFSRIEYINKISLDYSSVQEGEKLCRFTSGGFLEIAVNKGSAAQLFGLTVKRDQQLIYEKIYINFL